MKPTSYFFIITLTATQPLVAMAVGTCAPKNGQTIHTAFCSNKEENECKVHSAVCSWTETETKPQVIAVVQNPEKCDAKNGNEVHQGFCQQQTKANCSVHSLC